MQKFENKTMGDMEKEMNKTCPESAMEPCFIAAGMNAAEQAKCMEKQMACVAPITF